MGIKLFHTADLHLGMKFTRGYPPEVQESLIEARFDALPAMVETANSRDCDLFVVAGDLFDSRRVAKKDVVRAAESLKRFEGKLVLVLPGNHDYVQRDEIDGGEENLWRWFREAMGERTLLLEEARPYDLRRYDLGAIVYAAPCTAKHSRTNAIGWIRELLTGDVDGGRAELLHNTEAPLHVGIAHGSLEGLSPDFNDDYYPMTMEELEDSGVDLWLMGHTHIRYPDRESGSEGRVFFPSTPEPDGFDCRHPGRAWLIEIDENKRVRFESLKTGKYRFLNVEAEVSGEKDLEDLTARFDEESAKSKLVKLKLKGRPASEAYDMRAAVIEEIKSRVLYLEADLSELYRKITRADIDREFTEGSFPHRLLSTLADEQKNPLSLQMAYDFIRKAKS